MLEQNTELTGDLRFDSQKLAKAFAYIEETWPSLTQNQTVDDGTLIGLPYPFIKPSTVSDSGFSFEEMYYWDSYFIAQGYLQNGHHELAAGLLEDLLSMARRFHIIPQCQPDLSHQPLTAAFSYHLYF